MNTSAFLIFCEGAHDIAFLKLILTELTGYKREELKFSEMPYPLNKLFPTLIKEHAMKDMKLDMTHKFFLPDVLFRKEEKLICLFNCGNKDKVEENAGFFLPKFYSLLKENSFAGNDKIDNAKYLFIYDADADNTNSTESSIKNKYKEYGEVEVFIFQDENNKNGTLEDIVLPMFEEAEADILKKAETAMEDMFKWDIESKDNKKAIAELARFKKSVITIAGQRKKPGSSMNVIMEQSKFLTKDILKKNSFIVNFMQFLEKFGI